MCKNFDCLAVAQCENERGRSPGLPSGWVSIVGVVAGTGEQTDVVEPRLSGVFCSTECAASSIHSESRLTAMRPSGLPLLQEEVHETREMQATRLGLTVLDLIHYIAISGLDTGAMIPLDADYENMTKTFMLTALPADIVDETVQNVEE